MTYSSKLMFMMSMMIGTLITISSYSWLSMWMGLEINLLSIIPILNSPYSIYPSESALKYFITQTMASSVMLFSIIMQLNMNEFTPQNSNSLMMLIMNSALLTKMGAAPFHAWFPEVMEGLNWENALIMLTWQKIAPMVLVMYNLKMTTFITVIIITSASVGGILGLNQISFRKIMAYSSINHISWMLSSMISMKLTWMTYFLIYSTITTNIVVILKQLSIFYMKQLINSLNSNKQIKFFLMTNFLSLGGLPPFLGFLPKWLTINNLIQSNSMMLAFMLTILALLPLYFYLRIAFSALIISTKETLIQEKKLTSNIAMTFNFFSLIGMMLCTLMWGAA